MPYAQMETKYFWIRFFSLQFQVEWICGESFYAVREEKNEKLNVKLSPSFENRNFGIRARMVDQQNETENAFTFKQLIFINLKRNGMNIALSDARKKQCNHSRLLLITKATVRPIIRKWRKKQSRNEMFSLNGEVEENFWEQCDAWQFGNDTSTTYSTI